MGHSFGGKISLLYASMYPVKKIVVFGSPYKCKVAKDNKLRKFLPKAFIDFCDHHKLVIKKAYRYVLTRNLNYDCRSLDKSYAYRDAFQLIYSDSMKEEIIEDCMKLDEVDY